MVGVLAGLLELAPVLCFLLGEDVPLGHVPVGPHGESGGVDEPLGDSEDVEFHVEDLLDGVAVVGGPGEVGDLAGVDFLHLGGHEEGGEAEELEGGLVDLCFGEVAVEVVDGEVEGFPLEVELAGDLHHPVDEDGPHVPRDVLLAVLEVVRVGEVHSLALDEVRDAFRVLLILLLLGLVVVLVDLDLLVVASQVELEHTLARALLLGVQVLLGLVEEVELLLREGAHVLEALLERLECVCPQELLVGHGDLVGVLLVLLRLERVEALFAVAEHALLDPAARLLQVAPLLHPRLLL